MENFLNFCEELGAEIMDAATGIAKSVKINKKWIKTQIEAIPYILVAVLFCGAFWFITSMLAIMCEVQ